MLKGTSAARVILCVVNVLRGYLYFLKFVFIGFVEFTIDLILCFSSGAVISLYSDGAAFVINEIFRHAPLLKIISS